MTDRILAFDTSGPYCAAALMVDGTLRCVRNTPMTRGQVEQLIPLLESLLESEDVSWDALTRIGVGIGPGNFTGIRIAVSTARGLALALKIPTIGISTFDAVRMGTTGHAAVLAPRNKAYFASGDKAPELIDADTLPTDAILPEDPETLVANMAALARAHKGPIVPPAPLYVRPADAAPPKDSAPIILDDA